MFPLKLPSFENVVASSTAVMPRLPVGMMYNAIILELGGTFTQAQCSNIRLKANGKTIWDVEGAHLDSINNYDKLKDTATFLALWFSDPTVENQTMSQLGALDTSRGIQELSLEIDIGAATSPTLKGFYLASPPSPKGDKFAGFFKSVLKNTFAPGAAGQFPLQCALGSRAGGFVRRNHFFHTNVTQLAVKRDGVNMMDDLTVAEVGYINEQNRRTAASGHVVFDPISRCWMEDLVPTLRGDGSPATFEYLATTSGADTIKQYTELLAPLDRI